MTVNAKPPGTLSVNGTDGEPVDILNFVGALPPPSDVKSRNALVRAAAARSLGLAEDAMYAIARAVTDPGALAAAVKAGLVSTEVIGAVDIGMVTANVWLPEAFILMQPRAGGFAHSVPAPSIRGDVDDDGLPVVELEVQFENPRHLHDYIVETVALTKAHGRDYADSILAKRVSRPGLAHVVQISFADESESFYALCVRDGITRVVSSWSAQNPGLNAHELGEHIAEALLARRHTRSTVGSETIARARGREDVLADMRGRFVAGTSGEVVAEEAIRIGQTLTLPMQICISMAERAPSAVAAEAVFDDTMQSVIASVHGEFRPWEPTATQTAAIQRAIPRAVHAEALVPEVAAMAVSADVSKISSVWDEVPASALWRGICLLSVLTHHTEFNGLKRQLRELGVSRAISKRTYVSHLATVIDAPWRRAKANTEKQARRAWGNGGPIPSSMLGTDWEPTPTSDFLTLVPLALAGDQDAKNTLIVGGGIALIADKLLLADVGSALTSGQVPFRASVDVVVEGLAESEYGLCVLAHAANAFDADRVALNSFTQKELAANPGLAKDTYIVPQPDEDNPFEVALDSNQHVVPLTIYKVVYASNPDRAADEKAKVNQPPENESPPERANRLRKKLIALLTDATTTAVDLAATVDADGGIVGGPFGDQANFAAVDEFVRKLQLFVLLNANRVPSDAKTSSDDAAGDGANDSWDGDEDGADDVYA
ncbi:hypothetical protein GCM10023339_27750 [Alloalcanivorax gelatiniphagus]